MVVRASPVPLYIQIDEELRGRSNRASSDRWHRCPRRRILAQHFSVSRMTARKALDRLVGDGMLFRQPGKGTFVAPTKIAHGASQGLSFSAAMHAQGRETVTRVLEAELVQAPSNVTRALKLPPGAQALFLRRLRIVDGEPAAIHLSYMPGRLSALLEADLSGSLSNLMSAIGARVERSEDRVEAVLATRPEAELLGVATGSPLVLIRGTAYSANNEPIRYTEALYPGGRWQFSLEVTPQADLRPELKDQRDPTLG